MLPAIALGTGMAIGALLAYPSSYFFQSAPFRQEMSWWKYLLDPGAALSNRAPLLVVVWTLLVCAVVFAAGGAFICSATRTARRSVRARIWLNTPSERFTAGTLRYTGFGLLAMFAWMLWGDVVYTLMQRVFPSAMPLQLRKLGVPPVAIGIMLVWMVQGMGMFLGPYISFRSDRTRTRWGRRIPYIAATLPFLCLCMAALGFTDEIGVWVMGWHWPVLLHISPMWMLIIVMGALVVLYDFFNVYVNSVYWALFADVIPREFMGKFIGAFRFVGMGAGFIFSYFIFGKLETHTRYIYLGGAALYAIGFTLLCLKVREGQYAPPDDLPADSTPRLARLGQGVKMYFAECFGHPLWISYYVAKALWQLSNVVNIYKIFFFRDHLGFSLDRMGKLEAWMTLLTMALMFPMGWLIDKIHPIRALILSSIIIIPVTFAGYYIDNFTFYMFVAVITTPAVALFDSADMVLPMQLFPRDKYGQFFSGIGLMRNVTTILTGAFGAMYIQWMVDRHGIRGNAYAFIWQGWLEIVGLACMFVVYWYWRKYGGNKFDGDRVMHKLRARLIIPVRK